MKTRTAMAAWAYHIGSQGVVRGFRARVGNMGVAFRRMGNARGVLFCPGRFGNELLLFFKCQFPVKLKQFIGGHGKSPACSGQGHNKAPMPKSATLLSDIAKIKAVVKIIFLLAKDKPMFSATAGRVNGC